jgi:Na+-driven multidrug efflux pump
MANVSTARKIGIAARIVGEQVKRSRTYGAILNAARTTLGHFASVLHQLWLEITGFVFLAFTGVGAVGLVRQYTSYHAGKGDPSRLAAAAAFTLVFGWFGISSFWRVHRKK